MKRLLLLLPIATMIISGCSDAKIASRNLAKAAEMFELNRRIVFLNGITDDYILVVEGRCSIVDYKKQLEVTCKTGSNEFKKHHLGLSDNVTYFSEQLDSAKISVYQYRVIFKPDVIVPKVELKSQLTD